MYSRSPRELDDLQETTIDAAYGFGPRGPYLFGNLTRERNALGQIEISPTPEAPAAPTSWWGSVMGFVRETAQTAADVWGSVSSIFPAPAPQPIAFAPTPSIVAPTLISPPPTIPAAPTAPGLPIAAGVSATTLLLGGALVLLLLKRKG